MVEIAYTFESVVPHTGAMVLLDEIDYWDEQYLQASVIIRANAPFVDEQGLPAWVGVELMAQTIGAFGGCRSRERNEPVKIGFLVGSRRYTSSHSYFPIGAKLEIAVTELMRSENGLCVFECKLCGTGEYSAISAEANINVFQPENPERFLAGEAL